MNITFSLDETLIAAAKVLAARQDTSITAMVRSLLEQQVALGQQVLASGATGVLQGLLDFSMGRQPRAVTMQALGLVDYGILIRLLNAAGLPQPLVPQAQRRAMAAAMVEAVRQTVAS